MWWIYALLSALFAALTAIFAKIGIKGVDSDLATALRTSVILIITWALVITRGAQTGLNTLGKTNLVFICLSAMATGLSWIFYFRALQLGPVSKVASIDKLSVAIVLIFAAFFLREPLSLKTAFAASLIICGTIIMIF